MSLLPSILPLALRACAGAYHRIVLAAFALAFAFASSPSFAQDSSQSPIKLVVPFTPGTGIDMIARQVGPRLAERLGRPVFVENKPGASGNLGTEAVVRAPKDGTTLLVTVSTLAMNRALYPGLSFDPLRDLQPITLTSWGELLLVASKKSGINSAQDLIARAKARPGALNYGSPGAGTPHHLAMELLKDQAKVFITHVPYRGSSPAVTDLIGGHIDVMFLPIHVALPLVQGGQLNALAIGGKSANRLLPSVPLLSQLKLGDLDVEMWYGIAAPAGTPRAVVDRLNAELAGILGAPEIKAAFETQGMTPAHSTPEEFQRLLATDTARWVKLIKARNIQPD